MLHNERELFRQVVLLTAEETGINASIIEKDYYVSMYLKSLATRSPKSYLRVERLFQSVMGLSNDFQKILT